MQATQPLRTYQPVKAAIAAFVAVAVLIAAIVLASVLPSLGRTGAGSNPGSGFVPVRHDFYGAPIQAPLKLDPNARAGGARSHVNIPQ
jgi:hypothetical protein